MAGLRAATLALLLAARHLGAASATTFVCGSDYTDASENCTVNPGCPTGDGCPPEKDICFAMPDDQCFAPPTAPGPTPPPTTGPTAGPLRVCGTSADDARINCRSNAQCPGGDGSLCPMGTACFAVPVDQCLTDAPSPSPTSVPKVCGANFAAAEADCLDLSKRCPTGQGCPTGEACFSVPPAQCGATQTPPTPTTPSPVPAGVQSNVAPPAEPTTSPIATPAEPTASPIAAPAQPTAPPVPGFLKVCGANYTDASTNCRTNPGCPTGDGCPMDMMCFALPPSACPEPTTPGPTVQTTPQPTTPTTSAATTPGATPNPTPGPTPMAGPMDPTASPTPNATAVSPTFKPSGSPVYNRFFCGVTYEVAEANCWTAEPCPSGFGCTIDGEACFGIAAERCLSSAPTDAPAGAGPQPSAGPTASSAPTGVTSAPSEQPTKSPTGNVFYCGMTFELAESNCSEETACPTGAGCPGGMLCYNGIQCKAGTPAPSPAPTPTLQGIFGTAAPTKKPTIPTYEKYCGFSVNDATDNCAAAVPCPDGLSSACPTGQTCFPIPEACGSGATDPPTDSPVASPTFDINSPNFCGVDFDDALDNCYQRTPCPTGYEDECPAGQGCYPVSLCELPSPMTSPSPTTSSLTPGPTKAPVTGKPTWGDWQLGEAQEGDSASCMLGSGILVRSAVLAGAVLAALML